MIIISKSKDIHASVQEGINFFLVFFWIAVAAAQCIDICCIFLIFGTKIVLLEKRQNYQRIITYWVTYPLLILSTTVLWFSIAVFAFGITTNVDFCISSGGPVEALLGIFTSKGYDEGSSLYITSQKALGECPFEAGSDPISSFNSLISDSQLTSSKFEFYAPDFTCPKIDSVSKVIDEFNESLEKIMPFSDLIEFTSRCERMQSFFFDMTYKESCTELPRYLSYAFCSMLLTGIFSMTLIGFNLSWKTDGEIFLKVSKEIAEHRRREKDRRERKTDKKEEQRARNKKSQQRKEEKERRKQEEIELEEHEKQANQEAKENWEQEVQAFSGALEIWGDKYNSEIEVSLGDTESERNIPIGSTSFGQYMLDGDDNQRWNIDPVIPPVNKVDGIDDGFQTKVDPDVFQSATKYSIFSSNNVNTELPWTESNQREDALSSNHYHKEQPPEHFVDLEMAPAQGSNQVESQYDNDMGRNGKAQTQLQPHPNSNNDALNNIGLQLHNLQREKIDNLQRTVDEYRKELSKISKFEKVEKRNDNNADPKTSSPDNEERGANLRIIKVKKKEELHVPVIDIKCSSVEKIDSDDDLRLIKVKKNRSQNGSETDEKRPSNDVEPARKKHVSEPTFSSRQERLEQQRDIESQTDQTSAEVVYANFKNHDEDTFEGFVLEERSHIEVEEHSEIISEEGDANSFDYLAEKRNSFEEGIDPFQDNMNELQSSQEGFSREPQKSGQDLEDHNKEILLDEGVHNFNHGQQVLPDTNVGIIHSSEGHSNVLLLNQSHQSHESIVGRLTSNYQEPQTSYISDDEEGMSERDIHLLSYSSEDASALRNESSDLQDELQPIYDQSYGSKYDITMESHTLQSPIEAFASNHNELNDIDLEQQRSKSYIAQPNSTVEDINYMSDHSEQGVQRQHSMLTEEKRFLPTGNQMNEKRRISNFDLNGDSTSTFQHPLLQQKESLSYTNNFLSSTGLSSKLVHDQSSSHRNVSFYTRETNMDDSQIIDSSQKSMNTRNILHQSSEAAEKSTQQHTERLISDTEMEVTNVSDEELVEITQQKENNVKKGDVIIKKKGKRSKKKTDSHQKKKKKKDKKSKKETHKRGKRRHRRDKHKYHEEESFTSENGESYITGRTSPGISEEDDDSRYYTSAKESFGRRRSHDSRRGDSYTTRGSRGNSTTRGDSYTTRGSRNSSRRRGRRDYSRGKKRRGLRHDSYTTRNTDDYTSYDSSSSSSHNSGSSFSSDASSSSNEYTYITVETSDESEEGIGFFNLFGSRSRNKRR